MLGTAGVIFPYGNHSELPLLGPGFAGYDGGGIKRGVRVGGHVLRRLGPAWSSLGESRDGGKNEDRKLESE